MSDFKTKLRAMDGRTDLFDFICKTLPGVLFLLLMPSSGTSISAFQDSSNC